jgi:hypothetical protein
MKSDHNKRMITLTGDNIKRLSLYITAALTIDKCGAKIVTPAVGLRHFDTLWDLNFF